MYLKQLGFRIRTVGNPTNNRFITTKEANRQRFFRILVGNIIDELFLGTINSPDYFMFQSIMKALVCSSNVLESCPQMTEMNRKGFGAKLLRISWLTSFGKDHERNEVIYSQAMCVNGTCTPLTCTAKDPTIEHIEEIADEVTKNHSINVIDYMCRLSNIPLVYFEAEDSEQDLWRQYIEITPEDCDENLFKELLEPAKEVLKDSKSVLEFMKDITKLEQGKWKEGF